MIVSPTGKHKAGPSVTGRVGIGPGWLRPAGLLSAALICFMAGAYANRAHWDWWLENRIKSVIAATPVYVDSLLHAKALPVISLDVKYNHVATLEAKRTAARRDGWLRATDDDYVPAKMTADGKTTRAKIRLKGDRLAHIHTDKWSLRIKVKGNERPFGMRTFSVQHPGTRLYLNEWGFLENVRREGVLAVRYRFIRLVFNGVDKGIFALEEHFSKELLEAHGRREGVIVAFEESNWIHVDNALRGGGRDIATHMFDVGSQDVRTFDSASIERNPSLRAQRDEAVELLRAFQEGRRQASDVFDVELTGRYLALVDLWQAWHALMWQNSRFYYNPITARLEPIGFDAMALMRDSDMALSVTQPHDACVFFPLRDPAIARVYLREIRRFSDEAYLKGIREALEPSFRRWHLALGREFPDQELIASPWDWLTRRQAYIRSAIKPRKMVIASAFQPAARPEEPYTVDVRSIALLPVEILGFSIDGGALIPACSVRAGQRRLGTWPGPDCSVGIIPSRRDAGLVLATFHLPVDRRENPPTPETQPVIDVVTRFPGQRETTTTPARISPPRSARGSAPNAPAIEEALAKHAFLYRDETGFGLVVHRGDWNVQGDLVIPEQTALMIESGTRLRFQPGAVFLTTSRLDIHGKPDQPVVLEPRDDRWGGVVVSGAKDVSTWQDVTVRNTSGIARGGWMPTGGVTFHKSAIRMTRSQFVGSTAEDALNVIRADARLEDCVFARCDSDAFDGDSVTGSVTRCRFESIGGDAVDVSASVLAIEELQARGIGDKVISIGERSRVIATDIQIDGAAIAVACKDSSTARVRGAVIRNARYGLAAYAKKAEFGPAHIVAEDVTFFDIAKAVLVQTASSVSIDGVQQSEQTLNVEQLYADAAIDR